MDRMDALTDLCEYLKNWFDDGCAVYAGEITIAGGTITCHRDFYDSEVSLVEGQYFRICGSPLDDGVHCYPDTNLHDGTFNGTVTPMNLPNAIVSLVDDIVAWRTKYEDVDGQAMSPYTSESFAGYSYSKGGTGTSASDNGNGGWQGAFKNRLTHWRKI